MRIYSEISLENFEAWSGAVSTLERIKVEDKCEQLECILEDLYPDGMSDTQLNDLLWFEEDWVYEVLGIRTEEQIKEELEEAREQLASLMEDYANDIDDEELTTQEKADIWNEDYAYVVEKCKELIAELEEELENL